MFVYDEVAHANPTDRLAWIPLMNCFDAWLDYHGHSLDQNRSTRTHFLVRSMREAGFERAGQKGRFRVDGARLYVGTPDEFLADIKVAAEADGIVLSVAV